MVLESGSTTIISFVRLECEWRLLMVRDMEFRGGPPLGADGVDEGVDSNTY